LEELGRLRIPLAALLVNALTPPGCARCRRAAAREHRHVRALARRWRSLTGKEGPLILAPMMVPAPRGARALRDDLASVRSGRAAVKRGGQSARSAPAQRSGPRSSAKRAGAGTSTRAHTGTSTRAATGSATYLYAVVSSKDEPSASSAPPGLPEMGPLRWLGLGGSLWIAAADAPLARYRAAAVEKGLRDIDWVSACAVAHERMVEHLATLGTAVPMKLFTLFTSDARALENVGRARKRLDKVVRRIAGRREWGLRISVDEETSRAAARDRAAQAARGLSAGAGFLTRKRQEQVAARDVVKAGREEAEAVFDDVAALAEQATRRQAGAPARGLRMLLDAAFLVGRDGEEAFRARVRSHSERLAPQGVRVVLTGPWPPYNFVADAR
jgi:hypothetical protein